MSCAGCRAIRDGSSESHNHSEECRNQIEKHLEQQENPELLTSQAKIIKRKNQVEGVVEQDAQHEKEARNVKRQRNNSEAATGDGARSSHEG